MPSHQSVLNLHYQAPKNSHLHHMTHREVSDEESVLIYSETEIQPFELRGICRNFGYLISNPVMYDQE